MPQSQIGGGQQEAKNKTKNHNSQSHNPQNCKLKNYQNADEVSCDDFTHSLNALKTAFYAKSTTLNIPINETQIYHAYSAEINSYGGIFDNGKLIRQSSNPCSQIHFDYIKNLTLFSIKNKADLKSYAKKLFFTHISPQSRKNKAILNDCSKAKIMFFCSYFSNAYHFIIESYARLLLLLDYANAHNIDAFIIAPPKYRGFKKYHSWFIEEILAIIPKEKILYLDYQNYKCKNIYFASNPMANERHILRAVRNLQRRFYDKNFKGFERIYISRKKSPRRFLINDDEIAEILEAKFGFKRIFMEDYNLKDKINLMMNAKIVLTIEGTSAVNGFFMTAENAKLVTLRSYDMTEHLLIIAQNFRNIAFLPIVCENVGEAKSGEEFWVSGNLLLKKEYLLKKLQEYGIEEV